MLHRILRRNVMNIIFFAINILIIFIMIIGLYVKSQIIDFIGAKELSREEVVITINNKSIDKTDPSEEKYLISYSSENDRSTKHGKFVSKEFFNKLTITDKMPAVEITYKLRDGTIHKELRVDAFKDSGLDKINNLFFDLLVN